MNARAHAVAYAGRSRFLALLSLTLTVLVFLTIAGCRRGMPVDTRPQSAPDRALRGTIRASAVRIPVDGRTVEVVNVATGQRQQVTTGGTGEFSMRLTPGKYRVDVVLRGGESVVQHPGIIELAPSDSDARADFVVTGPASRPRGPAYRIDDGLGSPIA